MSLRKPKHVSSFECVEGLQDFSLPSLQLAMCRVAAVKRLSV